MEGGWDVGGRLLSFSAFGMGAYSKKYGIFINSFTRWPLGFSPGAGLQASLLV